MSTIKFLIRWWIVAFFIRHRLVQTWKHESGSSWGVHEMTKFSFSSRISRCDSPSIRINQNITTNRLWRNFKIIEPSPAAYWCIHEYMNKVWRDMGFYYKQLVNCIHPNFVQYNFDASNIDSDCLLIFYVQIICAMVVIVWMWDFTYWVMPLWSDLGNGYLSGDIQQLQKFKIQTLFMSPVSPKT